MGQGRKHRWLRRPSPSMVVALIALVFAMSGTAVAATHLVSGDSLIKKHTLSGNRLRNHTLTGSQIKLNSLGKVPRAAKADTATNASHATTIANGAVGTAKFGTLPGARVHNSSDETILSSALTTLSYNTEDFDTAGLHSTTTTTSRLTAPVAGKYLIMGSARWDSNTSGRRILIIELNGSTQIARDAVSPNNTSGFGPEQTVETVYQLAAGDYVEVVAYQDSGSTLSVQAFGTDSPAFSMDWLAP